MPSEPQRARATGRDAIARIFHRYDPPLWLVTARHRSRRGGFIATSVMRASIVHELPRVLLAVAKHHYTWGLIEASRQLTLHLLRPTDLPAVWRFGLASGHRQDKLSGLDCDLTPAGSPLYREAVAWMDCQVAQAMEIGDRTVYLAEVTDGAELIDGDVLTVATLMRDAPEARLAELKRLYEEDRATDRAAILAWQRARGDA